MARYERQWSSSQCFRDNYYRGRLKESRGTDLERFADKSEAEEFLCPICLCVAYEPVEHIPFGNRRCPYVFCCYCAQRWIKSQPQAYPNCPAGCSKSDFIHDNLRIIGPRDRRRMNALLVSCQFKCDVLTPHGNYRQHISSCQKNPANLCKICLVYRKNGHKCREYVSQLKDKVNKLENQVERLRLEPEPNCSKSDHN